MIKGFGDRLLSEIKRQANKDVKIKIFAPPERKYSTWIGASILAGLSIYLSQSLTPFFLSLSIYLGTFKKMWVSAEEYQEDPDIIHSRFLV